MSEDHGLPYYFVVYRIDLYQIDTLPERAHKFEENRAQELADTLEALRMAAERSGDHDFDEKEALENLTTSEWWRDNPWDFLIKIKEIFAQQEHAVEEVARLTELNKGKECLYFYQGARFYKDGRKSQQK